MYNPARHGTHGHSHRQTESGTPTISMAASLSCKYLILSHAMQVAWNLRRVYMCHPLSSHILDVRQAVKANQMLY